MKHTDRQDQMLLTSTFPLLFEHLYFNLVSGTYTEELNLKARLVKNSWTNMNSFQEKMGEKLWVRLS